ncbi:MAG: phage holin [Clostridia bacterium]
MFDDSFSALDFKTDQGLSAVVTVVVSLWSWWKNNSFTAKAIRADHARRK